MTEEKETERPSILLMTQKLKDLMEKRERIYKRFFAPWNVEKISDLAGHDRSIEKIFHTLRDLALNHHADLVEAQRKVSECLQAASEWRTKYESADRRWRDGKEQYHTLHEAYEKVLGESEQLTAAQGRITELEAEIKKQTSGGSGHGKKKKRNV